MRRSRRSSSRPSCPDSSREGCRGPTRREAGDRSSPAFHPAIPFCCTRPCEERLIPFCSMCTACCFVVRPTYFRSYLLPSLVPSGSVCCPYRLISPAFPCLNSCPSPFRPPCFSVFFSVFEDVTACPKESLVMSPVVTPSLSLFQKKPSGARAAAAPSSSLSSYQSPIPFTFCSEQPLTYETMLRKPQNVFSLLLCYFILSVYLLTNCNACPCPWISIYFTSNSSTFFFRQRFFSERVMPREDGQEMGS